MAKLIGISGSLRQKSYNTALLRTAIALAPAGTTIDVGTIKGIPLYDGDIEAASGIPEAVQTLKEQIAQADGVLLVTPEYNNSIPGVFKNAIDWLSRPSSDIRRIFGGRPVGLMGASPGPAGTALSQVAWLPVLRTLGMLPFFGARLMLGGAGKAFDAEGNLTDATARANVEKYVTAFARFVEKERGQASPSV